MGKVAIIGGGLAGCAAAYFSKRSGLYPIIFEQDEVVASAASGNARGMVSPRISAEMTPYAQYYSIAFQSLIAFFDGASEGGADIGWHKCGTLHLSIDTRKDKQFAKTVQNWNWDQKDIHRLSKGDVSIQAGIDLDFEALFLPQSGYVSPPKLCTYYADDVEVRSGQNVSDEMLADMDADIIVLACATGLQQFELARHIPFGTVRGQITKVSASAASAHLKCNLNYGGYCSPADAQGEHMIGATFQRWLDHSRVIDGDNQENIDALRAVAPNIVEGMEVWGSRAAVRCTTRDYFPVVGKLGQIGDKDVYISGGHGSHGILSSFMAAQILMDQIAGRPVSVPDATLKALNPHRFL